MKVEIGRNFSGIPLILSSRVSVPAFLGYTIYIAFISEDLGSPLCKDSQQEEGGICAVRPLQGLGGCASADLLLEKKRNIRAIRHIPTLTPSHPQPHIISLQLVWNPTGSN